MKRLLNILFISCLTLSVCAQNCEQVTDKLLQKLNSTALRTDYNIAITQPETLSQNYSGQITMKGQSFNLRMGTVQAFYNGKTMWVMDSDLDEINITSPTAEELTESNPLLLINSIRQQCRLHFTDNFNDKALWSVDFYPNNKKSEILKYTVQFRRSDLIPTKIIISEIHSKLTTIILSAQQYGVDTTGEFELNVKNYPEATINDMR